MKLKNLLMGFIAFVMCGATFTAQGQWDISATSADHVTATFDNVSGTLTISGTGKMKDYPYESDAPFQSISASITSLIIESGLTSVGSYAFYNCSNIAGNVTLPNTILSIGKSAFQYCSSITSINIPDHVTSIGDDAFDRCSGIASIIIPNSVISIGEGAFVGCYSITSVTIPASVTSIGVYAFYMCPALTAIDVVESNQFFSSDGGVLFDKNKQTLIYCPDGKTGDYVIPNTVSTIKIYAFIYSKGLTSITIPASISSIEVSAIAYCSGLTSLTCLNPDPSSIVLGNMVFAGGTIPSCTLYVPEDAVSLYQNADQWRDFYPNIKGVAAGIAAVEIQNLKIFPNPVKNELCITAESPINKVEIYSSDGKMLMQENNFTGTMNVSSLTKGLYMVKVYAAKGEATVEIVKK